MSDPSSESKLSGESEKDLHKYSTGGAPRGDDTVVRTASNLIREQLPDSQLAPPEKPPAEKQHNLTANSDELTSSEVCYRLFPLESGHPANTPLPETDGLLLDHFRLGERIGTGGMGAVFRATDERLDRVVAIKVLSPSQLHQPDAITRFENEARSAARLDHENIARVYTFSKDKGVHFIAYEYVTGSNIRHIIQHQGRLDVAVAVNYARQIASALNHTSAAGVVHRDIKPSNIIITPEGRAKLVDLGLARNESTQSSSDDLTVAGTTLGTFDYIAPEQAKDPRNVDVRSDIYALGCTLYHMLTGLPPYPEGTVLQKLLDHQASENPDPADKNPAVSPVLSEVVKKMMASNPLERYLTPSSLIHDLDQVAASMGMPGRIARPLSSSHRKKFPWESYIGWLIAGLILIVFTIGLDFFSKQYPVQQNQTPTINSPETPAPPSSSDISLLEASENDKRIDEFLNNQESDRFEIQSETEDWDTKIKIPDNITIDKTNPENEPPTEPQITTFRLMDGNEILQEFSSLEAACLNADTGQVIEISQPDINSSNVTSTITAQPVVIQNKSLTIVGDRGSGSRPLLRFELPQSESTTPSPLFTIQNGGALNLFNVDLHFILPQESKKNGSQEKDDNDSLEMDEIIPTLFALSNLNSSLSLKGVSLTLESPAGHPGILFRFSENPDEFATPSTNIADNKPVSLKIDETFIRSDSGIFEVKTTNPSELVIEDSLLVAEDTVLYVNGNSHLLEEPPSFNLDLNQSTVSADVSFLTISNNTYEQLQFPQLKITTENNIFTTRSSIFSFLEYQEFERFETPDDLITWEGSYNFFDQISNFRVFRLNGFERDPDYLYPTWKNYWDNHPTGSSQYAKLGVKWLMTFNSLPASQLMLQDFELDLEAEENPAVQGSSDDQTNAGAPIKTLKLLEFHLQPTSNSETRKPSSPRRTRY